MKKSILNNGLFLLLVLILFTSCRDNPDAKRAVEIFFLGVLQVINMILFGICAVIFCVISATSPKPVFKVLGWIFLALFALFALLGFKSVTDVGPRDVEIYYLFVMELAMAVVSLVFVLRKKQPEVNRLSGDRQPVDIMDDDEII